MHCRSISSLTGPATEAFPPMPLESWEPTKETLHRFLQIVGKIRLSTAPRRNHWWHVPFHLTGRGITTRPMGHEPTFSIDFDFVDHRLVVATVDGRIGSFPLPGNSVARFYELLMSTVRGLGIVEVIDRPRSFDLGDDTPFEGDHEHRDYDPFWVNRYWQILSEVNLILEEFSGQFCGKTSPVHHFWHTMDIAVTRFSDRAVAHDGTIDPVTREAYSREVISSGFWFGDSSFDGPAFYSYTAPEPDDLADQPLQPETAKWLLRGESHLAVFRYDDFRAADAPRQVVGEFLESAYQAGATLAGWDVTRLASPGGTTTNDG